MNVVALVIERLQGSVVRDLRGISVVEGERNSCLESGPSKDGHRCSGARGLGLSARPRGWIAGRSEGAGSTACAGCAAGAGDPTS
jgi:hypothetical protein